MPDVRLDQAFKVGNVLSLFFINLMDYQKLHFRLKSSSEIKFDKGASNDDVRF